MVQGYKITLMCDCHPRLVYHGVCLGDGITYESRTDDELSGRKKVNARFAELLEEHGRHAFAVEKTGDFDSEYDALMDEAERIKQDNSTHPDHGFNVEKIDKKRLAKALAEHTPGASESDLLNAALTDFKNNHPEWVPFDNTRNEQALRAMAKARKCSVDAAFSLCLEAGTILVAI